MLKRPATWLTIILALSLADSAYWAYTRFRLERGHRTVEVAVDMTQLEGLSAARGSKLEALLSQCREAGVTSVAISEATLRELEASGRVQILPRPLALLAFPHDAQAIGGHDWVVTARDSALLQEIHWTLAKKCAVPPRFVAERTEGTATRPAFLALSGGTEVLESMGAGFNPRHVRLAKQSGLALVCRYLNYPGVTGDAIRYMAASACRKDAHLVIFAEEEVLGYLDLLDETAAAFRESGIAFGTVEFAKQRGDARLAAAIYPQIIRVHSIAENEQLKLTPEVASRRFVRAAKERNIRLCYLRFFPQLKAGAVEDNLAYVQSVTRGLRAAGLKLGPAMPTAPFAVPTRHRMVASAGAAAGVTLLLAVIGGTSLLWSLAVWAVSGLALAGAVFLVPDLGPKLAALTCAIAFPTLAMAVPHVSRWAGDDSEGGVAISPLLTVLGATAITLAGALLTVCLLGDTRFMLKLDQFAGVKLSHLLPPLVVLACYASGLLPQDERPWRERWQSAVARLADLSKRSVVFWHAGAALVVLGAAAVAVLRTGNEPGFGVSNVELQVRDWMEQVLLARPRFKEFALGHPALVLAVLCAIRGWRGAVVPLLVIGALAQVSLFNTFCHTHTPLHLSLLRTFNGLWIGWGVGMLLYWPLGAAVDRFRPAKKAAAKGP